MENAVWLAVSVPVIALFAIFANHWLAQYRERSKDFNDIATAVSEALAWQVKSPHPGRGPSSAELDSLLPYFSVIDRYLYKRAAKQYQNATSEKDRDTLNQASYRRPEQVSKAAGRLRRFVQPR